ncbi:integrase zinc binding domain-containing protein, partial [Enterobacter cloacae complex sp. 4DZ3-17B2]|uniref:integrase zinc binding domain-containing protein n=1 Tax=Enterobacter cloacae complex sp. 4DZ3-17B2 TaxID=2511990 RepID=UPI0013EBA612
SNTKIIICNGNIIHADIKDRPGIIRELRSTPIGGHKGIGKTLKRIKQRYFWENMKSDIEKFIQNCKSCQLKKLTRVKTKQPMIISDTPKQAMKKIAMDIVIPNNKTEDGYENILTIQENLTK